VSVAGHCSGDSGAIRNTSASWHRDWATLPAELHGRLRSPLPESFPEQAPRVKMSEKFVVPRSASSESEILHAKFNRIQASASRAVVVGVSLKMGSIAAA